MAISKHGQTQVRVQRAKRYAKMSKEKRRAMIKAYKEGRFKKSRSPEAVARRLARSKIMPDGSTRKTATRPSGTPKPRTIEASSYIPEKKPSSPISIKDSLGSALGGLAKMGIRAMAEKVPFAPAIISKMATQESREDTYDGILSFLGNMKEKASSAASATKKPFKDFANSYNTFNPTEGKPPSGYLGQNLHEGILGGIEGIGSAIGGLKDRFFPGDPKRPATAPQNAPSKEDAMVLIKSLRAGGMSREEIMRVMIERFGIAGQNYYGMIDDYFWTEQ